MASMIRLKSKTSIRFFSTVVLTVVLGAALPGLPTGKAFAETNVRIGGMGGVLGTMRLMGDAFRKTEPGITVTVLPSLGSGGGIKALLEGAIDIAVSARPVTEAEKRRGAVEAGFSKSAFVFIRHDGQPATGLTQKQVADIYAGKTERWPDGTPVRLIMRPDDGSETKALLALSPEMNRAVRLALARKGMIYAMTDQETADRVEKLSGAFAPAFLPLVLTEKRRVRVLALDGVSPDVKSIADGSYPLVQQIRTVTGPSVSPAAKRFLQFLHSPAARKLLVKCGQVPED